jgi:dephospho-CoA kinase
VDADESQQMQRLMTRDSVSADQAHAILAAQATRAERLQAADDMLVNSGSVPELRQAVDRLHQRYLELAATAQRRGV